MEKKICKRAATVQFWDGYAPWYKLWMEHNNYHDRIIEVLTTMVEPGWKVLDIGAGNGVLALPLCAIGCDVTVLEPSIGMRNLLYEESFKRGIDWINIDERRWEDLPVHQLRDYELIMVCNSLHLTQIGFEEALKKIFRTGSRHVFVITELGPLEIKIKWQYGDYTMLFTKCYETESSFAYHHLDDVFEHWAFKKGRPLYPDEMADIKSKLTFKDSHLWIKDTAYVGMYWWERIVAERRQKVDELEKLKRLLRHWMEHNNEHVQLYRDWAEKASPIGNRELCEILRRLSNETEKLNRLFEEAIKMIG